MATRARFGTFVLIVIAAAVAVVLGLRQEDASAGGRTSPAEPSPKAARAERVRSVPAPAGERVPQARPSGPLWPQLPFVLPGVTADATRDWRTFTPARLSVRTSPSEPAREFAMTETRTVAGRTVWVGRAQTAGAFVVSVAGADYWHATITVPGQPIREVKVERQTIEVTEAPETDFACGNATESLPDLDHLRSSYSGVASSTGTRYSDVAFFYTSNAVPAGVRSAQETIEVKAIGIIESANQVLEQSGVKNLRWRFVGARQVPDYRQTTSLKDDVDAVGSTRTALGRFVAQQCVELGADQGVLFVGAPRRNGTGRAEMPGRFCVLDYGVPSQITYVIVAHEMAHNFGCQHDRATVRSQSGGRDNAGDGLYSYGFMLRDAQGRECGTVMSYAATRIPFFSNPDITWEGSRLGLPAGDRLAADNARVLRELGPAMTAHQVSRFPEILAQPAPTALCAGETLNLNVAATGERVAFQWRKNGVAIEGATAPLFCVTRAGVNDTGAYDCVVTNDVGQIVSATAVVSVASGPADPAARLCNLSTRAWVDTGEGVEIVGFAISGTGSKRLLLRAAGPALAAFHLPEHLVDPRFYLVDQETGGMIASNDDWDADPPSGTEVAAASRTTGAFGFAPGSKDAALLVTLRPGIYTMVVSGANGATGIALAEVYECDATEPARLVNLSTRSAVCSGDGAQIAGFVVSGTGPKRLLIRAAGPALSQFGVTLPIRDPRIQLYEQATGRLILIADDWDPTLASDFARVGAFPWTVGSSDAACVVTLDPGVYTAVVNDGSAVAAGTNTSQGFIGGALVELYAVD